MITKKVKTITQLKKILPRLRRAGRSIVFTNGCFDILHYCHVKYLEDAKKKADVLIVGLNSDASVRKIKGSNRPLVEVRDRARVLAALESVDYVCIFSQTTPLGLIKIVKPDILVKGADWKMNDIVGSSFVKSYGGKVVNIPLVKGRSTTALIKKIAKRF